jgi:hypothetical protein
MTRFVLPLLAVLCLFAAGCGPKELPRGPVAGRVTLDGKPVSGATVVFECKALGVAQAASTDPDGRYEFVAYNAAGLPAGSYKVGVTSGRFMQAGEEIPLVDAKTKPGQAAPPPKTAVPAKYAKPDDSGLTAEVAANANSPFDFALKP